MKFCIHFLLFVINTLILGSVGIVSEGETVHDETDAELIDQYTQYQKQKQPEPISTKIDVHNNTNTTGASACTCVKYFECNVDQKSDANHTATVESSAGSAVPGGATNVGNGDILGIVDIRREGSKGNETTPNGCPHYFDVCCTTVKDKSEPVIGPEQPKVTMKNWTHWSHTECGHRNEDGIGFQITGATGGESQFGEFPWTVAIVQEDLGEDNVTKNVFICGGSLIHPQVILTAAHCVFQLAYSSKKSKLKARVGEWDTQTLDEPFPHQDRYIKTVVIHEQLYRKGLFNDIALLFLEKEVKLAPNVDTLCLPPLSVTPSDFDGEQCFSSGWGKDNFGAEGRYQEIMKKVQVPIVSKKVCESQLRKTRLGDKFRLHDSFVCAGGGGSNDTCVGDGGSPLVCKPLNSKNYVQFGIVSWGIGCGNETPGVYVSVRPFVPWILKKMQQNNLDNKFCTGV